MLIHQNLKLRQNGAVELRNVTDDAVEARAAHERRREHYEAGNPKGWSKGRTMLHMAQIPEDVYHFDPLCREYQRLRAANNPEEAKRVMRVFLQMNPQYRASEARI
jgi:hypothetical protein